MYKNLGDESFIYNGFIRYKCQYNHDVGNTDYAR